MALSLHAPVPTFAQVKARAASGMAGAVKAREELKARTAISLARAIGRDPADFATRACLEAGV